MSGRVFTASERRIIARRYLAGASSSEIAAELLSTFQAVEAEFDALALRSSKALSAPANLEPVECPPVAATPLTTPDDGPTDCKRSAPGFPPSARKPAAKAAGKKSAERAAGRWLRDISPGAAGADRKFAEAMDGRRFDRSSTWSR